MRLQFCVAKNEFVRSLGDIELGGTQCEQKGLCAVAGRF